MGHTVGYQIRLETRRSSATRLLFCTTGVLLRRLQCDPSLKGVSHIFVDEIHERDLNTDFLLIILKDLIQARPTLKLILMSATLNAQMFSAYFSSGASGASGGSAGRDSGGSEVGYGAPIIEIPGRTFNVTAYMLEDALEATGHVVESTSECARRDGGRHSKSNHSNKSTAGAKGAEDARIPPPTREELKAMLPQASRNVIESLLIYDETIINYDLIEELVDHIHEHADTYAPAPDSDACNNEGNTASKNQKKMHTTNNGAILIFLPGLMEITQLYDRLRMKVNEFKVYPLHSALSTTEQKAVFQRPPPGVRKIVIATNIAETSITIDDVIFVIDAGRVKENRYDHERRMAMLVETWVSRASAKQRRGRAGRVQPGICFHLFSSRTERHVLSDYTMYVQILSHISNTILHIEYACVHYW